MQASGSRTGLKEVLDERDGMNRKTEIEFDAVSCSVMENCGTVKVNVVRRGDLTRSATVRYKTMFLVNAV